MERVKWQPAVQHGNRRREWRQETGDWAQAGRLGTCQPNVVMKNFSLGRCCFNGAGLIAVVRRMICNRGVQPNATRSVERI
jgi:hypothetical protein